MKMPRISFRSRLAAAAAVATLVGGVTLATAGPASAYGNGEVYQVELSANISGSNGGGVWLWFGLSSDHTGDYHGADCGHGGAGAASDGGDVTWQYSQDGTHVVISGVVLNGLPGPNGTPGFPATVTVPAAYGHYTGTIGSFITLPPFIPNIGSSQLQVAP